MLDAQTLADLQAMAADLADAPEVEPEPEHSSMDTKIGMLLDVVNHDKARVFEEGGRRMIDLGLFTDAELGAIFRRHFSKQIAASMPAKREQVLAERAAEDAQYVADMAVEQEARKGRIYPAFMVGDLEVPTLDLTGVDLNIHPDATARSPYNKARNRLTDDGPLNSNKADDLHTEGYVPTTWAVLEAEHQRLALLAANRKEAKPVAPKATALIADNNPLDPAAVALAETCGITYEEALTLI